MSKMKYKSDYMSLFAMLLITLLVIGLAICLMPTVHAAEADVETWTTSGTCEWGIDPDGCLWIRPTDGVGGTLENWGDALPPWYNQRDSVVSVTIKDGVSAATCHRMFVGCYNCTSMDLSGLDTSNVINMVDMFGGCSRLTSLDLSGFNTSNVTTMSNMFRNCFSLTTLDVSAFDTSNVTDMSYMFTACNALGSLDLSNFITSNVTDMSWMFSHCNSITSIDVSSFDTSNVTNMDYMFFVCNSLPNVDLSSFNTSNVTTMSEMFAWCESLTSIDLSGFETGSVTDMYGMFRECYALRSVNVDNFETSNVSGMGSMFQNCRSLTNLDLSSFNTSNVENMGFMFYGCSSLASLDLSAFETSSLTGMLYMFADCTALEELDISRFDTHGIDAFADMDWETGDFGGNPFYGCDNLRLIVIGNQFALDGNNIADEESRLLFPYPQGPGTTGNWILLGDETGASALTPEEMRAAGHVTPGTWIWQIIPDPNIAEFEATLLLGQNASVPNATVAFTAAAGTGMAAVPGTSLEVLAPTAGNGVAGTPTLGTATFAAGDATVTSVDGVTVGANQKAVVKPVSIDFNGVTFAQPGIFRYLITEPSTGSGLTYDTQLGDAENGVRYQRVLDVYVQRVDNADTGATSYQIGGYVFHEVANAPAVGATAAADKSSGFVHEYDTKTVTLESRAAGNQSSIDKYFAYTITIQNPNNSEFTVSADWTNAADALNPTANPATKYDVAAITAANTAEWTSNADGSLSKTIYLSNGQKVELDGIPAGATYSVSVADEDYSPSWTAGDGSGSNNTTGNRVLNAMEDVVFTLTREGVVPTGVMLSAVPGLIIMASAMIAVTVLAKRKKLEGNA